MTRSVGVGILTELRRRFGASLGSKKLTPTPAPNPQSGPPHSPDPPKSAANSAACACSALPPMRDARSSLRAAQAGSARKDLDACRHLHRPFPPATHFEREHAPEPGHLACGNRMARMVREARVMYRLHRRVRFQECRDAARTHRLRPHAAWQLKYRFVASTLKVISALWRLLVLSVGTRRSLSDGGSGRLRDRGRVRAKRGRYSNGRLRVVRTGLHFGLRQAWAMLMIAFTWPLHPSPFPRACPTNLCGQLSATGVEVRPVCAFCFPN